MVLPRTREDKEVQVTRKVVEFSVEFSLSQVREALLEKYGQELIGPEGLFISPDAKIKCTTTGKARIKLTWEEDPERIAQLEKPPAEPEDDLMTERPQAKKATSYDPDFDG